MYWLVEDDSQFDVLLNSSYKKAFIEVIPSSHNIHPANNHVSLVYIRPIEASKGFMLGVCHNETLNVISTRITEIIKKFEVLYCRDKKEMLHYFPTKALYDISPTSNMYIQPTTKAHEVLHRIHKDKLNVNEFIPVVKHYEICENIFLDLKANINKVDDYGQFFNSRTAVVFNRIESNGISIQKDIFSKHFHIENGPKVYTNYNLCTTTKRPSNVYKNVNYGALSKKDDCRQSFIPTNDVFYEYDIRSYHPTLSSYLINYRFPNMVDIHSHLAELYKVDYKTSKTLTFRQLYGGILDEYKDIEFFKRIDIYVNQLWKEFNSKGYIECKISKYRFKKDELKDMNAQKLFNYVLQNLESSLNVVMMYDMLKILENKKTKLVLYCYDSMLYDICEEELEVMKEIEDIFSKNKLYISRKKGYNYGDMKDF